ncbi:MAG: hypothetical protein A3E87_07355 [Gammaproteobacteria bacterium RIFCSPHIGHO2_12_FULL_35_23]|nr:MAG: hypothetical protein A3E87_07355 [Gammaproteobacteria bacterium RIFCSPHIGHO2_12_FULL_35_23]
MSTRYKFIFTLLTAGLTTLPLIIFAKTTTSTQAIVIKNSQPTVNENLQSLQVSLLQLESSKKNIQRQIEVQIQAMVSLQAQINSIKKKISNFKQTSTGFYWVTSQNNQLPKDAFSVDSQQKIYICQASYANALYPGRVSNKGCVITYSGLAYTIPSYKILVSNYKGYWQDGNKVPQEPFINLQQPVWIPNAPSSTPLTATTKKDHTAVTPIVGGFEYNHVLYICRLNINNTYYVGKVVTGTCNVAMAGKEASIPIYQVLLPSAP